MATRLSLNKKSLYTYASCNHIQLLLPFIYHMDIPTSKNMQMPNIIRTVSRQRLWYLYFLNMFRCLDMFRFYVHIKLLHWNCIGTREFPKWKRFEIFSNFNYQTLDASTSVTSLITHTSSLLSVSLRACVCTNVQACTHMLLLMFVCECLGVHFCMLVCVKVMCPRVQKLRLFL